MLGLDGLLVDWLACCLVRWMVGWVGLGGWLCWIVLGWVGWFWLVGLVGLVDWLAVWLAGLLVGSGWVGLDWVALGLVGAELLTHLTYYYHHHVM